MNLKIDLINKDLIFSIIFAILCIILFFTPTGFDNKISSRAS